MNIQTPTTRSLASRDYHIPSILAHLRSTLTLNSTFEDKLLACYADLGLFGKLFFPDRFRDLPAPDGTFVPYTNLHYEVFDFVNNLYAEQRLRRSLNKPCGFKAGIIGCRGLAKSSIVTELLPMREISFGECPLYIPCSNSLSNAVMFTDEMRREFVTNPEFRLLVGDVRHSPTEFDESFGRVAFVINTPSGSSLVHPLGIQMHIRGRHFGAYRLRLGILDDVENEECIENPKLRKQVLNKVEAGWEYAVDQIEAENVPWSLWCVDTSKHPDCLIENLSRRPSWQILRVPVCDDEYHTRDPLFMSQETVDAKHSEARERGTIYIFTQELMARSSSRDMAVFHEKDRKYFNDPYDLPDSKPCYNIVSLDPSGTASPTSDPCGIAVWTVYPSIPALYLRRVIRARLSMSDQVELPATLCQQYNALALGVATTGLNDWASQPFLDHFQRNGIYSQLVFFKETFGSVSTEFTGVEGGKVGRGRPFASYYSWGLVHHSRQDPGIRAYELLLDAFPNCPEWDIAEASWNILRILKELKINLMPKAQPTPTRPAQVSRDPYAQPSKPFRFDIPAFDTLLSTLNEQDKELSLALTGRN